MLFRGFTRLLYILSYKLAGVFPSKSAAVDAEIVVVGIAPSETGVVFVVTSAAVVGVVHHLFGIKEIDLLFLGSVGNALSLVSLEKHRHQIAAVGEDAIAASADDYAVLIADKAVEGLVESLFHVVACLGIVAESHNEIVDRAFFEEITHLIENAFLLSEVEKHLASVKHQIEL